VWQPDKIPVLEEPLYLQITFESEFDMTNSWTRTRIGKLTLYMYRLLPGGCFKGVYYFSYVKTLRSCGTALQAWNGENVGWMTFGHQRC